MTMTTEKEPTTKTPWNTLTPETRLVFRLFEARAKAMPGLVDDIEHVFGVGPIQSQNMAQLALKELIWSKPVVVERAAQRLAILNGGGAEVTRVADNISVFATEGRADNANRHLSYLCMLASSEIDYSVPLDLPEEEFFPEA